MMRRLGGFYIWQLFIMWMAIVGLITFICAYGVFRKRELEHSCQTKACFNSTLQCTMHSVLTNHKKQAEVRVLLYD